MNPTGDGFWAFWSGVQVCLGPGAMMLAPAAAAFTWKSSRRDIEDSSSVTVDWLLRALLIAFGFAMMTFLSLLPLSTVAGRVIFISQNLFRYITGIFFIWQGLTMAGRKSKEAGSGFNALLTALMVGVCLGAVFRPELNEVLVGLEILSGMPGKLNKAWWLLFLHCLGVFQTVLTFQVGAASIRSMTVQIESKSRIMEKAAGLIIFVTGLMIVTGFFEELLS